jgi:23S rRNA pseudouridine1911/1915/1917 synthase
MVEMRLDVFLAKLHPASSRSTWQKRIKRGDVAVNGQPVTDVKTAVADGDKIKIRPILAPLTPVELPVIYQDDNVIVINKPAGILTHSKGALNDEFTVADFVKSSYQLSETEPPSNTKSSRQTKTPTNNRLGIIHRLDRATSGVIIAALNPQTQQFLQKQFANRTAKKTYLAVVQQAPPKPTARIDLPIGRNPKHPSQFRVDPKGKSAITDYRTLKILADGTTLLELKPLTGRTHQLRVHLSSIGSPIVGDAIYNPKTVQQLTKHRTNQPPMLLHAWQLEINLPPSQKSAQPTPKTFVAPPPPQFPEADG